MEAIGEVIELKNNMAVVSSQRSSACSSCHNCEAKGACHAELIFGEQTQKIVLEVENSVGAKVGDKVELSASTNKTLLIAALVFLVPFILAMLAYFCLSMFVFDITVLATALIASFVVSFLLMAKIMNIYTVKNMKTVIVRILEESK